MKDPRYKKISKKLKGRKITWADKISNSMKGNQNAKGAKRSKEWIQKHIDKNTGRIVSEKTKRKLSKINKGNWTAEKNPNWKGGISFKNQKIRELIESLFEYKLWRTKVFERDNWTCQTCQRRGYKLNAHHIKEVNKIIKENNLVTQKDILNCKELWNVDNGVTLCEECHKLIHNKNEGS